MQGPFDTRHVGQVGLLARQVLQRLDEGRKSFAPLRHVAARRRRVLPEVARQAIKTFRTHQLSDHRVSGGQRPLRQCVAVAAVGQQPAFDMFLATSALGTSVSSYCFDSVRMPRQKQCLQQGLLLRRQAGRGAHAAISVGPPSLRAHAASPSSTASGGMALSHSITVGTAPKRWMAWAYSCQTSSATRLP